MGKGHRKIISLKNLRPKGIKLTIGRPIAREPEWENQMKFQAGTAELLRMGYELYAEDMFSKEWWGNTVCSARNKIAETAVERDSDYVVFFDDDMTVMDFAQDTHKMIQMSKDIVAAIGVSKGRPHFPNIAKVINIGESGTVCDTHKYRIYEWPEDKPFPVDIVGTAFMVIDTKVFKKMDRPWFYMPPDYINNNINGEDTTFCFNAKMNGFEIWVDPTIVMGHLGRWGWSTHLMSGSFQNYKQACLKDAEEHKRPQFSHLKNYDSTHNLVPEVQDAMKKAPGVKRMFV